MGKEMYHLLSDKNEFLHPFSPNWKPVGESD